MAIDSNELRKGVTFLVDNNLYKVVEYSHTQPGRGKATIRVKARNLRTGSNVDMSFGSGEKVNDVDLDYQKVQYLYADSDSYHFMNTETYEQPAIGSEMVEDIALYLTEGIEVKLTFYNNEPLDIDIPITVEQKLVQVEEALRGDTATGVLAKAVTETGLQVAVPAFIKVGDTIRIDTRNGQYVTRIQ